MTAEKNVRDLIFVSLENWDDIWRRNQFICTELARRYQERNILFVGLSRNMSNDVRNGRIGNLRWPATYKVSGLENITVTHPLKLLPDSVRVGRAVNEWMFRRHVRRVMKLLGISHPLLWLNPHWAVHAVGHLGECRVIYDITDDWTSFNRPGSLARRTVRQDRELTRRADAVIVCSQRLFEMKRGAARRLHLIENGVNADHYARILDDGAVPDEAKGWSKPVFGYTGTIHPERVDVRLVEAIARQMGRGSLVFIGPNHLSAAERTRLKTTGRIYFVGPVPYAMVPEYMRAIDVFVVPHRVTAFTESLNPIKLWEYLAGGKPVVSTDVAGFRDYSGLVRIARTAEEFLAAMVAAEAEGSSRAAERQAVARENSWQQRVDAIEVVIAECYGERDGGAAEIGAGESYRA